jgi:hemoglobin-like flavoprotein
MNPSLAAIRASFTAISRRQDELARRFYDNLFRTHPQMRRMFPEDMARQREHLAAALSLLIRNLDSIEALRPSLMDLGARHVAFGVVPGHYPPVRDALLEAIEHVTGPTMTPDLRDAWRNLINKVCSIMLQGVATAALAMAQEMAPMRTPETRVASRH